MTQQNILLVNTSLQEATPKYSDYKQALEYCQSTGGEKKTHLTGYLQFTATFTPRKNKQFIRR
jgi:hypothetical protein